MIVTSDLSDDIKLHIIGTNMDQNIYLSFGNSYGWYFCQDDRYTSEITRGLMNVMLDLYDKHIKNL